NEAAERDLATIFKRYGEERYARQIARAIVRRRKEQPFERTADLVETIKAAIPAPARFGDGHPAKRVFQALRIAVNDELGALEAALPSAFSMLRPRPHPRRAPRPVHRERRVAGGVVWIGIVAALLAGVVAMNVAVLRLNMKLDHLGRERADLRAQNAALSSQLSSAAAAPRIQGL